MIPAVRALARAAMAARPVPLAGLQARAELPVRVDRGYLVPAEVFALFAAELTDRRAAGGPFDALCVNGRRWFRSRSVYYDTPDLRSFHGHRRGAGPRYTIRERLYEDTGERQFEVELPGRHGGTVKHRQPLLPGDPALGAGPRGFLAAVLARAYGLAAPADLHRSLETDHLRATFVTAGQRVTCDAALLCRDPATGRTLRTDGGLVLVRTRTAGGPARADHVLHGHGIRPGAFPPYAGGLGALRPELAAGRWARELRTAFPAARPRAAHAGGTPADGPGGGRKPPRDGGPAATPVSGPGGSSSP
ncbi:VTC domain-containing protein [Streptomyces lydicus]|uniref:VTC domain-containing protein n=1 Tax=Streptomyces lydicus TaxID=47763 RepID=UPI003410E6C1